MNPSHFSICSSASEIFGLVFKMSPFPITLMSHFRYPFVPVLMSPGSVSRAHLSQNWWPVKVSWQLRHPAQMDPAPLNSLPHPRSPTPYWGITSSGLFSSLMPPSSPPFPPLPYFLSSSPSFSPTSHKYSGSLSAWQKSPSQSSRFNGDGGTLKEYRSHILFHRP